MCCSCCCSCYVNTLVELIGELKVGQFTKNRVAMALGSIINVYRNERFIMDAFYSANSSRGKPDDSQVNCYRGEIKKDTALQLASVQI